MYRERKYLTVINHDSPRDIGSILSYLLQALALSRDCGYVTTRIAFKASPLLIIAPRDRGGGTILSIFSSLLNSLVAPPNPVRNASGPRSASFRDKRTV